MKPTFTLLGILFFFAPVFAQNESGMKTKDASQSIKTIGNNEFLEQPQIVKDFFSLDQDLFDKENFHYNRKALATLVKSNNLSSKKGWTNFIVSADHTYIIFENIEDLAIIEFKVIERGGKRVGFLNQISESDQSFTYVEFSQDEMAWTTAANIPTPSKTDFFKDQDEKDMELVQQFGVAYTFISPETNEVDFAFLDYETKRKSSGRYNREADYKYSLVWDDQKFWLEKKTLRK